MGQNRVVWLLAVDAVEEGSDHNVYTTRGWLDDSGMLRWSLLRSIRMEGTHDGLSYVRLEEIIDGVEFAWETDETGRVTVARVPV